MNNQENERDFFRRLILAWLHDPVDKALGIRGHEARARKFIADVLGEMPEEIDIKDAFVSDVKAAVEDRLPMPTAEKNGAFLKERTVDFNQEEAGKRHLVIHPLAGTQLELDCRLDRMNLFDSNPVRNLVEKVAALSPAKKFAALWRLLPTACCEFDPAAALLPADTRSPDHSIWNHLDLAAAFEAAHAGGKGAAMFSFSLGPVQGFIEQARSLRDLWSGSYILSWLAFHGMLPIIERLGPQVVVFPSLREHPFLDWYLFQSDSDHSLRLPAELLGGAGAVRKKDDILNGSLPNVFLAIVPVAIADELQKEVEGGVRKEWSRIADSVRGILSKKWNQYSSWDAGWDDQVNNFWDIRTVVLPLSQSGSGERLGEFLSTWLWKECWPPEQIRILQKAIRKADDSASEMETCGSWAMFVELVAKLMAAQKQMRHVMPHTRIAGDRPKCTLMGSMETMCPEGRDDMDVGGTHLRKKENLGAIALIKRFCWGAYFSEKFRIKKNELRFKDTATLGAQRWLAEANIKPDEIWRQYGEWSGQWIFQTAQQWDADSGDPERDPPPRDEIRKIINAARERQKREKKDPPRRYFAAFVMDGDDMGQWLRGSRGPKLKEVYHPKLLKYFSALGKEAESALEQIRPVTPAVHAAFTTALGNFARRVVPPIIEEHHGELVYAGGDDVMALLPSEEAIACLRKIEREYHGEGTWLPMGWRGEKDAGAWLVLMGKHATASAGVAIAHYKDDLQDTLQAARLAEKAAKNRGKNAMGIAILKRSGEHSTVVCPWGLAATLEKFVAVFLDGASDRWVYHLKEESNVLGTLGENAICGEIIRLIGRAEKSTRRMIEERFRDDKKHRPLGEGDAEAGTIIAGFFKSVLTDLRLRKQAGIDIENPGTTIEATALEDTLALIQAASFIARGQEG